jgi:hypothetical protein
LGLGTLRRPARKPPAALRCFRPRYARLVFNAGTLLAVDKQTPDDEPGTDCGREKNARAERSAIAITLGSADGDVQNPVAKNAGSDTRVNVAGVIDTRDLVAPDLDFCTTVELHEDGLR